jgi:hypothetical protein
MQPAYARRRAVPLSLWPTLAVAAWAVLALGFPSPADAKSCSFESAQEPEILNVRAKNLRCFKAREVVNAVGESMSQSGRFPASVRVSPAGRKFRCEGNARARTDFGEVQPSFCRRGDKVVRFQVVLSRVDP